MREIAIDKRTIGVNFNKAGAAEILLWSPAADKIELVIDDEGLLPLNKASDGYWELTTDKLRPGHRYRFKLNGDKDFADPASLSQPEGVHGASQALDVKSYAWTDREWLNPSLENYVLYELHTGVFTPEGTLAAIESKLDHLLSVGITAIELMPLAQFPGERNWGYDGVFPFAVQHSYGGAEGLRQLIDACHRRGLAVVIDVVYNHVGPEGSCLDTFAPYFTDKYNTPWGKAINFDDAGSDEVRRFVIENVLMWFRDFHADALRLDAVHAIRDFSPQHILAEIKQYTDALSKLTGRNYYLIVESDLNDPRFIRPLDKGGYGMDAQWADDFHHTLRVALGHQREGYYADFNGVGELAKAYRDVYVYDGQYSLYRQKSFGSKTDGTGEQFIVFSQNHDQVGNRMLGERVAELHGLERQKLAAAAVILSPFVPMLFMGEEWGAPNPFLYFVDHSDKDLCEAIRKGRKEEFAAFHAEGEAPDPTDEKTFAQSKLQWELIEEEPHKQVLAYYKMLLNLRRQHPALSNTDRSALEAKADEAQQTLVLTRWSGDDRVLCLMNFSDAARSVPVHGSEHPWSKIFDSTDVQMNGGGNAPASIADTGTIMIPPSSVIVYSNRYV